MSQKEPSKAWNAQHSMIPTSGRDVPKGTQGKTCQKEPSPVARKAWNAQHSMIPTAGRDVTKVTLSGTQNVPKRTVPSGTFVPKRTVPSGTTKVTH
ncbi:MAG: hypothetical protein IKH28_00830 [Lachnospiraceae bacterium]|nr:hypothetical protein [Lachnospiraceae bacterium]